jgi:hypothetical protein
MEAKVYRAMCRWLTSVPHARRRKREQFSDAWIIMVYLWSAINDRPVCWACEQRNWPAKLLDGNTLPSDSTMSSRLRSVGVLQLLERLLMAITDALPVPLVKTIDSKPLLVGAYSKDRDAKRGRLATRQFARGYRLHAVCHGRAVRTWLIASLNENDSTIGPKLLDKLEGGGGYAVGDNAYDTNECHAHATPTGHQLVAPARFKNRHVRDAKHNRPERLRALDLLASPLERCGQPSAFGVALYNAREPAESCFGELSIRGLNYLPAWVRGPRRVVLWTAAKLALHAQRCVERAGLKFDDRKH